MVEIIENIIVKDGAYIIAEIGVNYYDIATKNNISVIDAAKLMILEAKNAGCHAVKFQSYKAEKIASKNSPSYWDLSQEKTDSQYELFKKFDSFGEKEYKELANYCNDNNITFLSTPFDFDSADYLDSLMGLYKISSSDLTNIPFIKHIAKKMKPIILSTGAATIGEIEDAIGAIKSQGNNSILIMHCVLDYPTNHENANLNMIKHLKNVFPNNIIGFSDHTKPDSTMMVLTTANLYGAQIIEKHFTLDKTLPGNDHYHSMDVNDCKVFVSNLKLISKISGEYLKKPLECEISSRKQARRSIVARQEIESGTKITLDLLTFKRPGTGISPNQLELVLGRTARLNIDEDELLTWEKL